MSKPFARFHALMAMAVALMSSGIAGSKEQALTKLGNYKSRGHGKGKLPKSWHGPTKFVVPHGGGKQEVARRQRQLASGMLRTN